MTRATGTVAAGGVEIVYQSTGRGAAVLCVQGVGVAGSGWDPQVAALASRHRVLTFDNRGVGATARGPGPLSIERMAADVQEPAVERPLHSTGDASRRSALLVA